MIAKAIRIAAEVHEDQVDKGGEPYILHALEVMHRAAALAGEQNFYMGVPKESVMVVGVLHDAIEDADPLGRTFLMAHIQRAFGNQIFDTIQRLTRRPGEDYMDDYIERVAQDPIARLVKIADLTHNMDTGRLPEGDIGEKDFARWDKYRRALVRLKKEA